MMQSVPRRMLISRHFRQQIRTFCRLICSNGSDRIPNGSNNNNNKDKYGILKVTRCSRFALQPHSSRRYCRGTTETDFEAEDGEQHGIDFTRKLVESRPVLSWKSFEEHLFDVLKNDKDQVPVTRLVSGMRDLGFRPKDPRFKETSAKIRELQTAALGDDDYGAKQLLVDRETFFECIRDNIDFIQKAYTCDVIIPEWSNFKESIDTIYWNCFGKRTGTVASYIPQLSRYNPELWGVSVCTTDGQRHSIGDAKVPFSIQSASKPTSYALAVSALGEDTVHEFVGHEPSGHSFNHITLGHGQKPHNPLINAGAIIITSLLRSDAKLADRFDYVSTQFKRMCGGEFVGFNNSIFLSERETADRNFALAYYLKENKCFPHGANLDETMDFYFQLCSIELDCESGAVLASTLANGGICPTTGERILDPVAVRNTLSLMHSCGMYDYSGEFAFKVGLPAKSGVSGVILLVVPNVAGFCLWSPPIDSLGNSTRGIAFCDELVQTFNFHHYDNLQYIGSRKHDPRTRKVDTHGTHVMKMLFSAAHGDISSLRRIYLSGGDMTCTDYDGRTAIHLASAEGHVQCVEFLIDTCGVPPSPLDRWDHTPLHDAERFGHDKVAKYLRKFS